MAWVTPQPGTAGQVYTAAAHNVIVDDLNYLKAEADAVGLVLIATASLSAATTVSFNNCFSAAYRNYMVVSQGGVGGAATGGYVTIRMRASGSDNSSSNYQWQGAEMSASAVTSIAGVSDSQYRVSASPYNTSNSNWGGFVAYINNPFESSWTHFPGAKGVGVNTATAGVFLITGGELRVASSFDGFTVIHPQNITTTIRVYGLRDSL